MTVRDIRLKWPEAERALAMNTIATSAVESLAAIENGGIAFHLPI